MSYSGSTAGSTLANPPVLISSGMSKIALNMGSTINGAATNIQASDVTPGQGPGMNYLTSVIVKP